MRRVRLREARSKKNNNKTLGCNLSWGTSGARREAVNVHSLFRATLPIIINTLGARCGQGSGRASCIYARSGDFSFIARERERKGILRVKVWAQGESDSFSARDSDDAVKISFHADSVNGEILVEILIVSTGCIFSLVGKEKNKKRFYEARIGSNDRCNTNRGCLSI